MHTSRFKVYMLPAQILSYGLLVPYPMEPGFTCFHSVLTTFFILHFRKREELKLDKRILLLGFICLTGLMNALIGERDEISLVCYFVRCCINTVIGRPCYGGLALYKGKMDRRKKWKQKHRGTAVYSSLHSLTSDCCDS